MTGKRKLFEGHDFSDIDTLALLNRGRKNISETGAPLVPMNIIIEDPDQPRTEFDDAALEEMAESIRERGVLQPILIKAANPDGLHVIIAGARRFRASKLAGKDMIPALVRHAAADSYDQMIENIQREALSHRDIARFIRDQLAAGAKKSAIGKSLGKPPAWVSLYVDFFDMDPAIQDGMSDYGTRAAHELHAAMQIDADATRAFLSGDQPITTRSAAAFRQSLKVGRNEATAPAGSNEQDLVIPAAPVPSDGSRAITEPMDTPSQDRPSAEPEAAARSPVAPPVMPEPVDPQRVDQPSLPADDIAPVREPAVSDTGSVSPIERVAPLAQDDLSVSPAMRVRLDDRVGRLMLERDAEQGGSFGVVAFDDGAEEETRLSDLVLLEIVRADGRGSDDA